MKAVEIRIHNFRSICDATIALADTSVLVGTNNAGKTTVIDAIRAFYGKGVKFNPDRDLPHQGANDKTSWVEIEFKPTPEELKTLKNEYQTKAGTFRVRNYLYNESDTKLNGPYAYIDGELSEQRFYGFKSVGQAKFGELIYIPAVSKVDEHTKLSGPSALRDLVQKVLTNAMERSKAYQELNASFSAFESAIKTEQTNEGHSLKTIEEDISRELSDWEAGFTLNINPISIDEITKGLISHEIDDKALGKQQPIDAYGQGFQRHVIFTLIRIAAKYKMPKHNPGKKEFTPEFTWLLFEEPEAFLHPTQSATLSASLQKISNQDGSQVLISTHNPLFARNDIRQIPSICRLQRENCRTNAYQISEDRLNAILSSNEADTKSWVNAGLKVDADDINVDMEAIKYSLWLDERRTSAFFAEKVLLVEGPTETGVLNYMRESGMLSTCPEIYILDTIGKFNMHRFMRIFERLGIKHYVLYDGDDGAHQPVVDSINQAQNNFTGGIDSFDRDLEDFIGIVKPKEPRRKPQNALYQIRSQNIDLSALEQKVQKLVQA